jgi:1,4-dihydroxy-2-naphthoate octaprenyltransferase
MGLIMTRPGFLAITLAGCLLGFALAAACGCGFDWPRAALALVLALLAHAAANVFNDYHDSLNGADAANSSGLFPFTGGSRLIQSGAATVAQTRQLAQHLFAVVILGGLLMTGLSGHGLLVIGMAGVGLAWAYSAPPLKLMSRGLGEMAVGLCWWLLVLGADYVIRRRLEWVSAVTALSYGLMIANILLINGFPDARADAAVGKRTLVVRVGPDAAALIYVHVALLAHVWLALMVWGVISPPGAVWGLVSLPLSLAASALLWLRRREAHRLTPAIVLTIAAACVHAIGMALGLVLPTLY